MKQKLKANEHEQAPKKYERLQGIAWDLVKDNMKLLYVFESDRGNIKGIYTDGKDKFSHWMEEEEKQKYLESKKEKK